MANGKTKREPWEPRVREEEVINPKDPGASRKFQMQRRGGAFSDRIKIDPDAPVRRAARRKGRVRA